MRQDQGQRLRFDGLRGHVGRDEARAVQQQLRRTSSRGGLSSRRTTMHPLRRAILTVGLVACTLLVVIAVVIVGLALITAATEGVDAVGDPAMPWVLGSMGAIAAGGGIGLRWELRGQRERRTSLRKTFRLARFAQDNGFAFTPGPVQPSHLLPWPVDDEAAVSQVLAATGEGTAGRGNDIEVGNVQLWDHHRENGVRFGGYCAASLPPQDRDGASARDDRWPVQILLRTSRFGPRTFTQHGKPPRAQRVDLRGSHGAGRTGGYQLYAPEGHGQIARDIFTDEVIATLRRDAPGMDVEVLGDILVISGRKALVTTKRRHLRRMERVMGATRAVAAQAAGARRWATPTADERRAVGVFRATDQDRDLDRPPSGPGSAVVGTSQRGEDPRVRVIRLRRGKAENGAWSAWVVVMVAVFGAAIPLLSRFLST